MKENIGCIAFVFIMIVGAIGIYQGGKQQRNNLPASYNTWTTAKIVGIEQVNASFFSSGYTKLFVIDEHNHRDTIYGPWGQVGDEIKVICKKDQYGHGELRLSANGLE